MRRIISAFICVMMIFTCISCAAEAPEIVPEYISSTSRRDIDLDGMTVIIAMDTRFDGRGENLGYIPGTEFGDLAAQRVRDVENQYNCKINFVYTNTIGARAYNSAVGGTYLYDIIGETSFGLLSYMRANAFQNLATLDNLDIFDQSKWGNRYSLISTMYDGGIFGLTGAALPMRVADSETGVICVNETYIANIMATDPRDYFENGEWNWENFEKCIIDFAHINNVNQYVYSFSTGFGRFARDLGLSNGTEVVSMNEDGQFEIGYFTQPALDAYNQAYEWFNGATADNVIDYYKSDRFIAGEAVMYCADTVTLTGSTESIAYNMENFGIVPIPTGPNAKDANDFKTTYSSSSIAYAIPITAQDVEISALILDNLFEPFEGFETRESIIAYLKRNYFSDERDASLILELTQGDHMRYHVHMEMSSMFDAMMGDGIARSLESHEDSIYKQAEKSAFPAYKTLFEYAEYFHE